MTSPRDVIARAVDGPDSADPSVACYAEADGILQVRADIEQMIAEVVPPLPTTPTPEMIEAMAEGFWNSQQLDAWEWLPEYSRDFTRRDMRAAYTAILNHMRGKTD